ncbi:sensor histidine kinase [Roseobacter sinensis]|uniref:histidine kinase n=1 Tax=Roseobacter sinensis TaxID=2931391 RepID=A0ABT3BAL4_9RHOB|nr:ATP-binding protein [Roseobacter sp. WL0113]MCV3270600.1 ATP-binding protein [Roseobacter sp. WL0113]
MRLLLLVAGGVTVAACFAGFTQLREISSAHGALTQDALPVLIQTQSVERDLSDLSIALERANSAQGAAQLIVAKHNLIEQIETVRERVIGVTRTERGAGVSLRMQAELARLDASVGQLLAHQNLLFEAEDRIAALDADLMRAGAAARDALEGLRVATEAQIEAVMGELRSGTGPGAGGSRQPFSDLFLAARSLTGLSAEIDAILTLSRSDQQLQTSGDFNEMRDEVEARLTGTAELLARLDPSADLAGLMGDLKQLVLQQDGLIAIAEARLRQANDVLALRQSKLEMSGDVSQFIDEMLSDALSSVAERSRNLDEATRLLSIILMVCLFLAATTTLIGHTVIIEQQINRRVARLNDAVKAIANGDLDHPIDVSGNDEFGDIARALHVFKQNAEELRRSNTDLERFAYVAAHDLRAPLRAVHDLSEWTLEDDQNVLTDESRSYLLMMQARTDRLDRLLVDLLDYARAGQEQQDLGEVDLAALVEQVTHMLAPPHGLTVRFTGPARGARTYATPLKQILINLISNAIKHHDRATGSITVSAAFQGGRLMVEVTDDGPGIPLAYQDRIYELFQTLKPRDEVEGSGLGLAIIRKILDRYRSELTLQSNPETARGATFRFDLPAEEIIDEDATAQANAA